MTLTVHPSIERECRLVDRDDPLVKVLPRAAAQPAREGEPPDFIAGPVLKHFPHLLRVVPVAVVVLDQLDRPGQIYFKMYRPYQIV